MPEYAIIRDEPVPVKVAVPERIEKDGLPTRFADAAVRLMVAGDAVPFFATWKI
jgi:hypothetical protein